MADYGVKASEANVSVLTATGSQVLMTSQYPFAKIDQTMLETFRTTTVTFLNDVPNNVKTQIAFFPHGYTYRPQVWGLWNVTWGPNIVGTPNVQQNGYGNLTNSSGFPASTFSYEWNETNVYLYLFKGSGFPGDGNAIGTVATLTTYIFADDLSTQSYADS